MTSLNNLRKPIPVAIEKETEKYSGYILKITTSGLMVELDNIQFKVGTYLNVTFSLNESTTINHRVRSVKHYKDFYRNPKKKVNKDGSKILPKMLCEMHFHLPLATTKMAITKFLIQQKNAHVVS